MSKFHRRPLAGLAATALGISGAIVASVPGVAAAAEECVAETTSIQIFSFNDFHGRVEAAPQLFTVVEEARAALGENNVLLTSNGDSIGGSTFVSAVADDNPTLDVLNAAGLEVSAAGNHEFDKGWSDLSGRVAERSDFPYVAANVLDGAGNVAAPLKAYELIEKGGVTIAVVGAVTRDLPSLVSPAGIAELDIIDPVEAVNSVAADLKDGDDSNGEADIVIASIHEGAPFGSPSAEAGAAASQNFANIHANIGDDVDVVFNGHTHYQYDWETSDGRPLLQANDYAQSLMSATFTVDSEGTVCGTVETEFHPAPDTAGDFPRISAIEEIVETAVETASVLGAEVVGNATEAISTPGDGGSGTRDVESPMSNMVAQMFHDMIGQGDPEFIGVQNPGGTRDSFDAGDITYEEAALVLPFANSLFTTQITGAQFKTVLEQQWQRDVDGEVPSRPFLALGLSDNVTYTYDETRDEGDRITGVYVNGAPIVEDQLYTVGSGSFLISGGDNFHELANGVNTADAGLVDLTAWVEWITQQGDLSPDYTKRGVAVNEAPESLQAGGDAGTYTIGAAVEDGVNPGTLDMFLDAEGERVSPQLANTTVTAYLGDTAVGTGTVSEGVGTVEVSVPADVAAGDHLLRLNVQASGTDVLVPLTVTPAEEQPAPTTPGLPSTGV